MLFSSSSRYYFSKIVFYIFIVYYILWYNNGFCQMLLITFIGIVARFDHKLSFPDTLWAIHCSKLEVVRLRREVCCDSSNGYVFGEPFPAVRGRSSEIVPLHWFEVLEVPNTGRSTRIPNGIFRFRPRPGPGTEYRHTGHFPSRPLRRRRKRDFLPTSLQRIRRRGVVKAAAAGGHVRRVCDRVWALVSSACEWGV